MIVLGVETATPLCGVAVVDGEEILVEYRVQARFSHAEHLLGLVDQAMSEIGIGIEDLDGVALTVGPGYFTGLRIGVATVKGLLSGLSTPVAAVPTLEALAWNVPSARIPVCPMLDARKGEVYAALFEFSDSGDIRRMGEDRIIAPDRLLEGLSGEVLFLGEGAMRNETLIRGRLGDSARFAHPEQKDPAPSVVARIGLGRLVRGEGVSVESLEPIYLRRSDAEVHLARGRASSGE
jgi:tRNA threonylcarbamoyladenosine biosynthesis protein TsaB